MGRKKLIMDEQIKLLKAREKVIIQELEFSPLRSLEQELYELRDTLSKLENKDLLIYNEYDAFDNKWTKSIIKYE
jgi:hypothetical protein